MVSFFKFGILICLEFICMKCAVDLNLFFLDGHSVGEQIETNINLIAVEQRDENNPI